MEYRQHYSAISKSPTAHTKKRSHSREYSLVIIFAAIHSKIPQRFIRNKYTMSTHSRSSGDSSTTKDVHVSFGSVHVRDYERILDDSVIAPIDTYGSAMPLAIGWGFQERQDIISVEDYTASSNADPLDGVRDYDPLERISILTSYGFSLQEVNKAVRNRASSILQGQQDDDSEQDSRGRRLRFSFSKLFRRRK
jgi:hypothetical protein